MNTKLLRSYITGFILSILLTLAAYIFVEIHVSSVHEVISHAVLTPAILGLAILQLIIQMFFFLHIGSQPGRSWKLFVFLSTLALVLIIAIGSLWIMNHLSYNMTPAQMDQYINNQQGGF